MTSAATPLRPLLLGLGWFPDQPGGLNRYLVGLLRALEQDGLSPSALVVGPAESPPPSVAVAGSAAEALPLRALRFARAAAARRRAADVVDSHFSLYSFLPVVLGPLRFRPLVVHFQGPWSEEGRALGERGPKVRAKRAVEGAVYRRARRVVVLSEAFKRELVERFRVPPWRIEVIPPGVDLEHFSPGDRGAARRRFGVEDGEFVAVAVRRLVPRMGLETLLEAWSLLVAGDGDATLLVAGDGQSAERLRRRARELELGPRVRFLGAVTDDELADLYRAADVCVVPTVELEGFGLVVLESLACGTPAVVTDAAALPETVRGLDRTLVVPARDGPALARRLREARNGSRRLPPASRCREHAERFAWPRVAARHRGVYEHAIRPRPRSDVRVVFLDHCARLSGAEIALLRLLPELRGVESHVVLGEPGPLEPRLAELGISTEVLEMPLAARSLSLEAISPRTLPLASAAGTVAYTAVLVRRLRQLRPDIVHANSLKAAVCGLAAARLAGVPAIWHARNLVSTDYLPPSAVEVMRAVVKYFPPAAVIANSRTTLATLPMEFDRAMVLPSPVIHDPLAPVDVERAVRDGFRVGIVGRISPWKGQDVFLEAFARAFPGGDERAVVIGAPLFGEEGYERELHRASRELGVADRVEFTGFRDDVNAELAQLDVLVHASVIPEPFGQVVVEGLAAGVPVVAADAGGPAEIIDNGIDGILVPPSNVDALAEALRALASDRELRRRLGAAGREKAKRFAPGPIAAEVTRLYRVVLSARRGRRRTLPF